MKKIIGVGVLLKTRDGRFLLQERDDKALLNPERIAPFGGGVEGSETATECALREMYEELNIVLEENSLDPIGLYEINLEPGSHIQMFLVKNIEKKQLTLKEGKDIVEFSVSEALCCDKVTNFTKMVLRSI